MFKTFCSLFSFKKLYSNIFYLEINFTIIWMPLNIYYYSLWITNNLIYYGRRGFKLTVMYKNATVGRTKKNYTYIGPMEKILMYYL